MPDPYPLLYTGEQIDSRLERPVGVSAGGTGQVSRYTSVAAVNDTSVVSGHNVLCRYFPYLSMCFFRATVQFDNVAVSAGTWTPIVTIPAEYAPAYRTALSATMGDVKAISARVKSDGVVEVGSTDDLRATSDYYAYISGWWAVPSN